MPFKKAPKSEAKGKAAAKKKPGGSPPSTKKATKKAAKKSATKAKPAAKPATGATELAALRERLVRAEAAAVRVVMLEEQLVERERELEAAINERQTALERLADLEQRLAESAEGGPPAPRPVDGDQRRIAELETALASRDEEVRTLRTKGAELLVCPRCGGEMVEFVHLGVTLDRCTSCAGLFFDSGELQEVLRREYPEPAEPAPTATDTPTFDEPARKKGFFRSLFGRKD